MIEARERASGFARQGFGAWFFAMLTVHALVVAAMVWTLTRTPLNQLFIASASGGSVDLASVNWVSQLSNDALSQALASAKPSSLGDEPASEIPLPRPPEVVLTPAPEPILRPIPKPQPASEPQPEPKLTPVPKPEPKLSPVPPPKPDPAPQPKLSPVPAPRPEPKLTPTPKPAPKLTPSPNPAPKLAPTPAPTPAPKLAPAPGPTPKPNLTPRPKLDPAPAPKPSGSGVTAENLTPIKPKIIGPGTGRSGRGSGLAGPAAVGSNTAAPASEFGDLAAYHAHLFGVFDSGWRRPADIQTGGRKLRVKVRLTIARSGQVVGAEIVEGSGHPIMDSSVGDALQRIRSVDPLPDFVKNSPYSVILNFDI